MLFQLLIVTFGCFAGVFGLGDYKAIAVIDNAPVKGVLTFYQANDKAPVEIRGEFSGLTPGDHGFHIHVYGDLSKGCESAGDHFNPFNREHGGPGSGEVHVGDLGNLRANRRGKAVFTYSTPYFSLQGSNPNSVIGRSVVIHANRDDLGLGNNEESKKSGNSGDRIACAVIGIAQTIENVPRGHYIPGFVPFDHYH